MNEVIALESALVPSDIGDDSFCHHQDDCTEASTLSYDRPFRSVIEKTLLHLPDELILHILRYILPTETTRLSLCCKRLYNISNEIPILSYRILGSKMPQPPTQTYVESYNVDLPENVKELDKKNETFQLQVHKSRHLALIKVNDLQINYIAEHVHQLDALLIDAQYDDRITSYGIEKFLKSKQVYKYLTRLAICGLREVGVYDLMREGGALIRNIGTCRNLKVLDLDGLSVLEDWGIKILALADLPLEFLAVSGSNLYIALRGLISSCSQTLRTISISDSKRHQEFPLLTAILECPNLRNLRINNGKFTCDAWTKFFKFLKVNLRRLSLAGCKSISNEALKWLVEHEILKDLEFLDLGGCVHLTDHVIFDILKHATNLMELSLASIPELTSTCLLQAQEEKYLSKLEIVNLQNYRSLDHDSVYEFSYYAPDTIIMYHYQGWLIEAQLYEKVFYDLERVFLPKWESGWCFFNGAKQMPCNLLYESGKDHGVKSSNTGRWYQKYWDALWSIENSAFINHPTTA